MGSLIPPELTLDCSISSNKPKIPKSTGDFLAEVSRMDSVSEKVSKLDDYVNRLQEEMKKIDAFKRELPLCMLLLNDAIATIRNEIMRSKNSNPGPILEEFIPMKKSSVDEKDEKIDDVKQTDIVNRREKMNWMSSVQLWNSESNSKKRKEEPVDRLAIDELFRSGKNRALAKPFSSFKRCNDFPAIAIGKEGRDEFLGAPSLSLCIPEIKNSTDKVFGNDISSKSSSSRSGSSCGTNSQSSFKAESQQTGRKQRRCWSPELHRRFVSALQQLGGAQAATPKQIRELMQVDGLTNDEVKSHLQKYRLHTRRVAPTTNASTGISLWASQEQCGESSKPSNSNSSSPQGPLHLTGSSRGTSITGGDSVEDEDDDKSESHSWKSHKQSSKRPQDV